MSPIPRRSLLKAAAVAGAAAQFSWALGAKDAQAAPRAAEADDDPVTLDWLEDGGLGAAPGSTVGVPWPKGAYHAGPDVRAHRRRRQGRTRAVLAARLLARRLAQVDRPRGRVRATGKLPLAAGHARRPRQEGHRRQERRTIDVVTGVIKARSASRAPAHQVGHPRLDGDRQNGRLVLIRQPEIEDEDQGAVKTERFDGAISEVTVEQAGPVRAVVRIDGKHRKGSRQSGCRSPSGSTSTRAPTPSAWCTPSSTTARRTGKASGDFIRGLGVRFTRADARRSRTTGTSASAATAPACSREAVKGITGLRRDPGAAVRAAQIAGDEAARPGHLGPAGHHPAPVHPRVGRLHPQPALRRRLHAAQAHQEGARLDRRRRRQAGRPASATSAASSGGFAFGLRDFWQRHPTQLDIRGAARPTRPRSPSGSGRPRPSRWTCASTTTAWARTPTPSSSKASTSPTRTTSPASARRTASPAPAS